MDAADWETFSMSLPEVIGAEVSILCTRCHYQCLLTLYPELILLVLCLGDLYTLEHVYVPRELLPQKVSNLDLVSVLLNDDVDGEMRIDGTELVSESLCDSGNHVFDEGSYCSQAGIVLAASVPHSKLDLDIPSFSLGLDYPQIHINVFDGLSGTSRSVYDVVAQVVATLCQLTLTSFPRGPSTVIVLALISSLTSLGTVISSSL